MCRLLFPVVLLAGLLGGAHSVFPYYGKLIRSGFGPGATHGLTGDIYAVDANTFQVINFSFDGLGPDAAFLLSTNTRYSTVRGGNGIDADAVAIANPMGQMAGLRSYSGATVVLRLPAGRVLTDFTYIAVGDRQTKRLYGGVDIPARFVAPAPQVIGTFQTSGHDVGSGSVTVLNDRMIKIKNFRYDGTGPDAFFYVGVTDNIDGGQRRPYGKIPDENGVSNRKARAYGGRDITLTLPATMSATDLKWLSMWCVQFAVNFGAVRFPSQLSVPPYIEEQVQAQVPAMRPRVTAKVPELRPRVQAPVPELVNCEPLSDNLQVSWTISRGDIIMELAGNIERSTDYMAFGLSGSDSTFSMFNADVVVADWRENSAPRAIDYFITAYSQCAVNGGACPDTSTSNGGTNNVRMPTGRMTDGILRITFKRALVTNDGNRDKAYRIDGRPQQIVWAIGPLNTVGETAKHYPVNGRISMAKAINFGRRAVDNCPAFNTRAQVTEEMGEVSFKPHHLYGRPDKTVFTAELGLSGSTQGYMAITGRPSWGIAWYINGILIPELHLKRGVTYTFRVAGGTNPDIGARYHPLYFTDSVDGAFSRSREGTIYPGMVNGVRRNFATGDFCEWKYVDGAADAVSDGYKYQCFEEYKADLQLVCDNNPSSYTEFMFTPDSSTPDLIYYQCYTHRSLGWKIHVYDELPTTDRQTQTCSRRRVMPAQVSPAERRLARMMRKAIRQRRKAARRRRRMERMQRMQAAQNQIAA